MSMHLAGPGLTTTGKKKGKVKWASAAAKKNAALLEQNWATLMETTGKPTSVSTKKKFKITSVAPQMSTARITESKKIPSLVTPGGECTKKDPVMYTGDKVLGIAVLHKSCLQPIFNQQAAIDVSKMRR